MEYNFLEYSKEQLSSLLPELIKEKKVLLIREIFDEYNIVDLSEIFRSITPRKIDFSTIIYGSKRHFG